MGRGLVAALVLLASVRGGEQTRVALVMSTHVVKPEAPANWEAFVVGPLSALYPLTTFVCVGPAAHAAQATLWAALSGELAVAPPPAIDFDDQYTRLAACYAFARAVERARGGAFTHWLRARPDLRWAAPIAPLHTYAAGAVSLRARGVLHATPTPVPHGALSGSPKRGCDYFAKVKAVEPVAVRAAMRAAAIPTCAVVDDMWAIVPAAYADAYFSMEPGFPGRPDLAAFTNASAAFDAAHVAAAYGTADADGVVRACALYGASSWRAVFDRAFHGRYGVGSHDFRHGCCEGRLTWRLVGRRVPTAVAAFPFVFTGRGGRGDPVARMERRVDC